MLATRVAEGIISKEQAQDYGWLNEPHKSNGFLERYNESQKPGKVFECFDEEKMPEFLIGANLEGANLTGANLEGADLIDANLIDANLTGANLSGAKIDAASILLRTSKLHGVDFTNTRLYEDGDLLTPYESRQIIIKRMISIGIADAKGLGDSYQAALVKAEIIEENTNDKSEAEIAQALAGKDFKVATNLPSEKQEQKIYEEPTVTRDLDI